jgi:hypothetical protein
LNNSKTKIFSITEIFPTTQTQNVPLSFAVQVQTYIIRSNRFSDSNSPFSTFFASITDIITICPDFSVSQASEELLESSCGRGIKAWLSNYG